MRMANMLRHFLLIFLFIFLLVYHSSTAQAGCGGELTGTSGTFGATSSDASHSYGDKCEWKVQVAEERNIILVFDVLHLYDSTSCSGENVKVYDFTGDRWGTPQKYCGTTVPHPIISTGNQMKIIFQSRYSLGYRGFAARYFSTFARMTGCGGEMNEWAGSFVSPSFPSDYPENENCTWQITVARGRIITLNFIEFDIEGYGTSSSCVYDNVKVYDGINRNSRLLDTYCYNNMPASITSSENKMTVHFQSDGTTNRKGFHAVYHSTAVFCGQPPVPQNGHVTSTYRTTYEYDSAIQITCNEGHTSRSGNPIRCQYKGRWSGAEPFCEAVSCGRPTTLNAKIKLVSGTAYVFRSEIEVNCNEGLHLKGEGRRRCQADGQWTGEMSSCEIVSCGKLQDPNNGKVHIQSLTYGSTVNYTCNRGYYHKFDTMRTCLGTGVWSGYKPSCYLVSCRTPITPSNAKIRLLSGTAYVFGSEIEVICNEGYDLKGEGSRQCQADGQWSGEMPHCEQILCDNLTAPAHGKFTPYDKHTGKTPYGQNARFSCDERYVLDGPSTLICRGTGSKGSFDGQPPTCKEINCEGLSAPMHGKFTPYNTTSQSTPYGENATFSCDERYVLDGPASLTCRGNDSKGSFDGQPPTCKFCGGELTGALGNFTSPNYPNKSPSNKKCEWNITAPIRTQIHLHFTDFECGYDNITVYDGTTGTALYDSCGNAPTEPLTSSGNVMRIVFKTNPSNGPSRFTALYNCTVLPDVQTPKARSNEKDTTTPNIVILGVLLGLALLVIVGLIVCIVLNRRKKSENAMEMQDRNANHTSARTNVTNMLDAAQLSRAANRFSTPDDMEIEDNLYYDSFEASGGSRLQLNSTAAAGAQRGPITGDIYAAVNKRREENLYANM